MRLAIMLGANYVPDGAAPPAWAPTDLGAGLIAWYKADSIAQADNTAVTSWADSSGNGWTATEATNAPTLQTNEINGLPVVRFDATNDILTTATVTHGIGTGDFAFCYVIKVVTFTGFRRIQTFDGASGNIMAGLQGDGGGTNGNFYFVGDKRFDTDLSNATWYTLLFQRVGTALSLYINGVQDTDTALTASGSIANNFWTFSTATAGQSLGMDLAEVINHKGTLSAGDRTSMFDYLRTKYAHY